MEKRERQTRSKEKKAACRCKIKRRKIHENKKGRKTQEEITRTLSQAQHMTDGDEE